MIHRDLSFVVRGSIVLLSRSLAEIGISAQELFILLYLYEHNQSRQEDIVDFFMLDKGTIARTLQKMEGKGLVVRVIDENDQRKRLIQLSDKGYSIKDVCINIVHNWHKVILKDLPEQDLKVFEQVLKAMAYNVATNLEN